MPAQMDFWHWWVIGLVLIVLEVFLPGTFFLWMGVAAGVVGVLLFFSPDMGWQYQLLVFAVLSVGTILVWRAYLKRHPIETDRPTLNRRGEQYVGRTFTLQNPVVNGSGKIHVDDSIWKISGPDCGAGTQVRVIGVNGVILEIEVIQPARPMAG